MSKMKDVMIDLQEAVMRGNLSFSEIASLYGVPLNWVYLALTEVLEQEEQSGAARADDYAELESE